MTKPTLPTVFNKLFEDGDYYITDEDLSMIGFERDSIIIHPCPHPNKQKDRSWPDIPFNITMILPYGEVEECMYCKQTPSEALVAVYKLQNFDHFASDYHDESEAGLLSTNMGQYISTNT